MNNINSKIMIELLVKNKAVVNLGIGTCLLGDSGNLALSSSVNCNQHTGTHNL